MNLDEAIKHCEEKEREQALNGCFACAEEHKQLAEWLKDYKRLLKERPQGEWVGVTDYIKHLKETTGENYLVNSTYYDCEVYCNKCWEMSTKRAKFCPNCGAKMQKGSAE